MRGIGWSVLSEMVAGGGFWGGLGEGMPLGRLGVLGGDAGGTLFRCLDGGVGRMVYDAKCQVWIQVATQVLLGG